MNTETPGLAALAEAVESLRNEVVRLSDRLAALEAPRAPAAGPAPGDGPLAEELIAVIGAAVAAYLGKRANVRQIRLIGSAAWGLEGRVTIQASHRLPGRN